MSSCDQTLAVSKIWMLGYGTIFFATLTAVQGLSAQEVRAQENNPAISHEMSFDELANITVSTASRRDEPLSRVSAALTVVTAEDIERMGVRIIPEAMRYVPGLEVAQINAHDWAVSARGFNSRYANKQLVLQDGRTLYSPFSGGVYWEAVGPPVAEIEQIEIIRGPGATVWGANAMNGVINIVTKPARETQGGAVSITSGTEDKHTIYAGYGMQWGRQTWARVSLEAIKVGEAELADGSPAGDAGETLRAGIRVDHGLADLGQLLLQASVTSARLFESGDYPRLSAPYRLKLTEPSEMVTAHVLARWSREAAADNKLTLQGFWSHEHRNQFRNDFTNDTFDLDFTHQVPVGGRQGIVWGGGVRLVAQSLAGKVGAVFPDPTPTDEVLNVFFQDQIQLQPDRLSLTLGTKVEYNNVTHVELEPSVRLAWHPTTLQTVWAAASRSVHTPSVLERNIRYDAQVVNLSPLTLVRQISEGNNQSEEQIAYELGYRFQPATGFSVDATVFYNDLPTVQAFRRGTPFAEPTPGPAHIVVPLIFDKTGLQGESHGVEVALRWQATSSWRLFAEYNHLVVKLNTATGLTSFSSFSPRHRFGLRSSLDLPHNLQLDLGVRCGGPRPGTAVASYLVGDAQLMWRPNGRWEVSVVAQNLGDRRHPEITPFTLGNVVEIPTTVFAKLTWRFP